MINRRKNRNQFALSLTDIPTPNALTGVLRIFTKARRKVGILGAVKSGMFAGGLVLGAAGPWYGVATPSPCAL